MISFNYLQSARTKLLQFLATSHLFDTLQGAGLFAGLGMCLLAGFFALDLMHSKSTVALQLRSERCLGRGAQHRPRAARHLAPKEQRLRPVTMPQIKRAEPRTFTAQTHDRLRNPLPMRGIRRPERISLQAVVTGSHASALLSQDGTPKAVSVGDWIGGMVVSAIREDEIRFSNGTTLHLAEKRR